MGWSDGLKWTPLDFYTLLLGSLGHWDIIDVPSGK